VSGVRGVQKYFRLLKPTTNTPLAARRRETRSSIVVQPPSPLSSRASRAGRRGQADEQQDSPAQLRGPAGAAAPR
jgi:hypothetical protein